MTSVVIIAGVATSSKRQRFRNQRYIRTEKRTDIYGADVYQQSHAAHVWLCSTVQQKQVSELGIALAFTDRHVSQQS